MDEQTSLEIQVIAASKAEADDLATELKTRLESAVRGIEVTREKAADEKDTLLIGTVLVAALGTKAVIEVGKGVLEVCKGVRAWLEKNQNAKVIIKKNGEIIIENARSGDVDPVKIADAVKLLREKPNGVDASAEDAPKPLEG